MKIFNWLFAIVLSVSFIACSNDDDNSPGNTELTGTWNVTGIDYEGSSTTVTSAGSATADFTGTGTDMNLQIEFTEDPDEYTAMGDYSIDLVIEVMGQTTNSQWSNEGFIGDGVWERNGDDITITPTGEDPSTVTIMELTESTLILEYNFTRIETTPDFTSTAQVEGTYTFERN